MHDTPPASCDQDALFDVLADSRRRHLIGLLRESDQTDRIFLDSLSKQLAERDTAEGESREQIAIELHHCHLPKLDAVGLIRYDPSIKMVELTGLVDEQSAESVDIALRND